MTRRSHPRYLATVLMVLSLLFSQLALANYLCPVEQDAQAMTAMIAAGEPCSGMDEAQPALCFQHLSASSQAVDQLKVGAPTAPALLQVLFLPALAMPAQVLALPVSAEPEIPSPPDPLFLSTLRLRV